MLGGFKTFQNASLFVELKIFCLWAPDTCSELCLPINTVLPKHSNSYWAKFPWESYFWLGSEVIHSWICNPHSVQCVVPEKALKFAWLNAFVNLTYSCTALAALSPKESFLMDCSISLLIFSGLLSNVFIFLKLLSSAFKGFQKHLLGVNFAVTFIVLQHT